jgi:predicted transglutaminase-like cysteine proteinase
MFKRQLAAALVLAFVSVWGGAVQASQDVEEAYLPMITTGPTSIPVGAYEFCRTRPEDCRTGGDGAGLVVLTEVRWSELLEVNARFNDEIVPVTDLDLYGVAEYWTYPDGYGDCEDYVLAKRKALLDRGWPASALLITVVRKQDGEGHAVLMVPTDRGEIVLDNLDGAIQIWTLTPYEYLKRQSQADLGQWVGIADARHLTAALD